MRLVVGITGCSGEVYGVRFLEACRDLNIETDLIVSPAAEEIMSFEIDENLEDIRRLARGSYGYGELDAAIASGSTRTDGMVIIPCSMKTLGAVASGVSDNLVTRSADVTLKEGRPLVLVPRETPLNLIHLENMAKLNRAGATILPAMPGFYHDPQTIEDLVDFIVGKVLDQFGVEHQLYQRWKSQEK